MLSNLLWLKWIRLGCLPLLVYDLGFVSLPFTLATSGLGGAVSHGLVKWAGLTDVLLVVKM